MSGKRSHRRRRLWASGSPVLVAGVTALMLALATLVAAGSSDSGTTNSSRSGWLFCVLLVVGAIGLVLLCLQWRYEYRRRTYDPTWALKFDDKFNSVEMRQARAKAAKLLKENQGKLLQKDLYLPDIEDILDFFEDLGFYMEGDQITPEVTHHAFHHWIVGYYTAAKDYIAGTQETEPTAWEYVGKLFETVDEIEMERAKQMARKSLDHSDLEKFLNDEIGLDTSCAKAPQ